MIRFKKTVIMKRSICIRDHEKSTEIYKYRSKVAKTKSLVTTYNQSRKDCL